MKKFTAPIRAAAHKSDSPSVQIPTPKSAGTSGATPKNPSRNIMTLPCRPRTTNRPKKDSDAPAKINEGTNTEGKASTFEKIAAGKFPVARNASRVTPERQPSTLQAPTSSDSKPHKNTARKSMPKLRAPNLNKPKKPAKPLTDKAYEDIFNKVLNLSPGKPESLAGDMSINDKMDIDDIGQSDLEDTIFEIESDQSKKMYIKKKELPVAKKSKKTLPNDSKPQLASGLPKGCPYPPKPRKGTVSATESDLEDLDEELGEIDKFMQMDTEDNPIFKKSPRNDSEIEPAPVTSKETRRLKKNIFKSPTQGTAEGAESTSATTNGPVNSEHNVERAFRGFPRKIPEKSTAIGRTVGLFPSRKLKFDVPAESNEEWVPPAAGGNDIPITPVNVRAAKRSLDYDETPVNRFQRKKSTVMKETADEDKENVLTGSIATERRSSTSSYFGVSADNRRSPLSDKLSSRFGSPKEDPAIRRPVSCEDVYPESRDFPLPSSANASQELTAADNDELLPPASSSQFKKPLFKTPSQGRKDISHSQPSSKGRQDDSHSQHSSLGRQQDDSHSQHSSQGRGDNSQFPPSSQDSTVSIPSSQLDTPGKMQWLLPRRMVGTWVQCNGCQKWRYIRDIHDPSVFPERWYCILSPDLQRKRCEIEEQPMNLKEEALMIWNDYAPGSIVWARVDGYPWWPAIVDDDPDYFQYYWLDAGATEIPVGAVKAATLRALMTAKKEAQNAIAMPQLDRLRKYGMLARFQGKFNKFAKKRVQPTAASDSD